MAAAQSQGVYTSYSSLPVPLQICLFLKNTGLILPLHLSYVCTLYLFTIMVPDCLSPWRWTGFWVNFFLPEVQSLSFLISNFLMEILKLRRFLKDLFQVPKDHSYPDYHIQQNYLSYLKEVENPYDNKRLKQIMQGSLAKRFQN